MKKLIKVVKSRFFLAAFCIILVFAELMTVYLLLYKYFLPITILAKPFYFGVFLYIINKDENIEFKLPWIIIILLLPIAGSFMYILLASNGYSKKEQQKFKNHLEICKDYDSDDKINLLQNDEAKLQARYLCASNEVGIYNKSTVTYYKIGEEFNCALLEELARAKNYIFMEYFIVEEGIMFNAILDILKKKAQAGVEVYFMYDDFGCMTTLPEKYYKELASCKIHAIPSIKLNPQFSNIYNNRDHRKITVIDGKIGFTGGINLADEYINEIDKHGHWKDTAVKIEGEAVKNLTKLFLGVWNFQNKEQLDYAKYLNVNFEKFESNGVVIPYGDGPSLFYGESVGKNVYLNMINMAKKYIYITTPYLICDNELLNALRLASKRGIDVRIITPHIPDKKYVFLMTRSNYYNLIKDGVRIYEYKDGFIHAKEFVCDDVFATCGTINLDYRSLTHHFECGVWMYNMKCIKDMKKDIIETFEKSIEMDLKKSKLKGWRKLLAEFLKVFTPLM